MSTAALLLEMNRATVIRKRALFFFFKQKTAYEIKECDWSDVCSSDLKGQGIGHRPVRAWCSTRRAITQASPQAAKSTPMASKKRSPAKGLYSPGARLVNFPISSGGGDRCAASGNRRVPARYMPSESPAQAITRAGTHPGTPPGPRRLNHRHRRDTLTGTTGAGGAAGAAGSGAPLTAPDFARPNQDKIWLVLKEGVRGGGSSVVRVDLAMPASLCTDEEHFSRSGLPSARPFGKRNGRGTSFIPRLKPRGFGRRFRE